tara:strand:- start:851 stop:1438 length:588 start_codon:yes stop_codon:yes gene_type:complete
METKGGFTEGPSHADGGIPMTVKSTGQKIEVEGGEGIINKHSMADNRQYTVQGTPKQIASAINEIDGKGISFDKGAKISMLKKGGMLYEPLVSDRYIKSLNRYDFYVDDGENYNKIGHAKIKENYNNPHLLKLKSINIDKEYADPKTYAYFTQAVINKANKKGAVMKIECIGDECMGDLLHIGELNENCDKIIIK